jgi:hypothetical protein
MQPFLQGELAFMQGVPCVMILRFVLCSFVDGVEPFCRMDIPVPTTLVGTRTDYSVGP